MAITGSFGKYVFEINQDRKVTYSDLSIESEANWEEHKMLNVKPRSEFLHAGKKNISLSILFSISLGIIPEKELEGLRTMQDTGEYASLIIGSKNKGKFYISSISEEHKNFDNKGNPILIKAKLSFKEFCDEKYVDKIPVTSTTTTTTTASSKTVSVNTSKTSKTSKKNVKETKKIDYEAKYKKTIGGNIES